MLKNVRKSKILLSFIAIILMFVLCGNLYSFATEENTTGNTVTITPITSGNVGNSTGNNSTNNTNTADNNTTTNSIIAPSNNTANNTNVASNANNTNNTANNTTVYNNTNSTSNSSGLPYTGTNSKAMLLIIVFAISAVYAYKKVSDYNV